MTVRAKCWPIQQPTRQKWRITRIARRFSKPLRKAAGKPSEIVIYPDAGHGFNADYRPSYNPQAARDGWKRMLAWYKEHGVA